MCEHDICHLVPEFVGMARLAVEPSVRFVIKSMGYHGLIKMLLKTDRLVSFIYHQAKKNREISALQRSIDEVPSRAELAQYQRRFIELYNQGEHAYYLVLIPNNHQTFNQGWFNVAPASQTVDQH